MFDVNVTENNVSTPKKMWFKHFHTIPYRFYTFIFFSFGLLISLNNKTFFFPFYIVWRNVTKSYFVFSVGSMDSFFTFPFMATSSVIQSSLIYSTRESGRKSVYLFKTLYILRYFVKYLLFRYISTGW